MRAIGCYINCYTTAPVRPELHQDGSRFPGLKPGETGHLKPI